MTDRELEQKLAEAFTRAAPDDLEAILSRCGGQNGSVMELNELKTDPNIIDVEAAEVRPKRKLRPWLAAACAALVLLGAGGGGLAYYQSRAVASIVSLDVNPSIELKVNRAERVISCTALNTEAAAVLFDMDGGADLKGTKLDVAVNAIVGALVREGYLDSVSSAILISVEDKDQNRAQRLQAELVASVDGVLQTQAPGTSVLSQTLDANAPAPEYMTFNSGLSAGKSALVYKVMEMNGTLATNSTLAFDKLAALSVEELNDLLEAGEKRIPIGKDAAALAVDEYAGTIALSSPTTDVDPELEKGIYEVELHTAWGDFDYTVDAFTGEVLSGQKDLLNQTPAGQDVPVYPDTPPAAEYGVGQDAGNAGVAGGTVIDQEAAKKAALDNAGLSESDVTNWKVERDWDDGQLEYEIEFWCGNTEYDYTIHGHTGAVLKCGIDHHEEYNSGHHSDAHHGGTGTSGSTSIVSGSTSIVISPDIGQAAAKTAALTHAGVTESQTTGMKVERDWDDGRLEYEVEFRAGQTEYEYTVDGVTGAILEYEWDD